MPASYVLATQVYSNQEISKCLYFDPNSNGSEPWFQLKNDGKFEKQSDSSTKIIQGEMACGLAVKITVKPSENELVKYNLVWDIPMINFPNKMKKYYKKYTDYFGREDAGLKISQYALQNYEEWEREIYRWQNTVLKDA